MRLFKSINLNVSKRFLLLEAALVWTLAGGMLLYRGGGMLNSSVGYLSSAGNMLLRVMTCFGFGGLFYRLVFSNISQKHIGRIKTLAGDYHFFYQFFSPKSYLMMIGMIAMGIFLRTSALVPLSSLSIAYMTMGFPLLISSLKFYYNWYNYPPAIGEPNN